MSRLSFLLLQARNQDDPMLRQEVRCFSRALSCEPEQIRVVDLISGTPSRDELQSADIVLLGGSGDYSVAEGGDWLEAALDAMRELHDESIPTFASCWGFQAMARAMGGEVVTDLSRAELGSVEVELTGAGREDPVFGRIGVERFGAQMGHQDVVTRLPGDAVLLASSQLVTNQAFRFEGRPIYCTQFHPELDRSSILERVWAYPQYVERIAGVSLEAFAEACSETPHAGKLLDNFIEWVRG